ncbi:MAG: LysR family transcriptional regulator [Pseudomonadota bacterium]
MNISDLQTIIDVKSLGSFARVARAQGVDPSVVSRTVANVEDALGVRLFQRTTRRLTITDAGERYIRQVEPLIDELRAAASQLSEEAQAAQGTVRLSAPVSIGRALLLPHLSAFNDHYPDIRLECYFDDRVTDLVADGIDIAIRMAPFVSGDLICTKLRQTRYRVVASPRWLSINDAPTNPTDLTEHECVLFTLPGFRDQWIFRNNEDHEQTVPVSGKLLFSNGDSVVDAMLSGLGPALLTDALIAEHLSSGRCIDLFPDHRVTATTFDTAAWIVYPSRNYLPLKTRTVIDFLKENLA